MKRTKLILKEIDSCRRCDFWYVFHNPKTKLDYEVCLFNDLKLLDKNEIPDWCPLEDTKEK